jgi:glycosyltransferase involved in cell wall biosynthesis
MKVAIVHDWLTGMRGGERCLEAFLDLYPHADIFTLVHIPGTTSKRIDSRVKRVSFLNRCPGIAKLYRGLLPLFPLAAWSLKIEGYDLVISLSHAAAKNVRVAKGTPHICYCFTPMRYIWDQAPAYFKGPLFYLAQPILWPLRVWDKRGAARVTEFVAISSFIAARIRRFYGRRSIVIPPPVRSADEINNQLSKEELEIFNNQREPFFLCAGALVPYKRVDVAISSCNKLNLPLWILGKGPELEKLKAKGGSKTRFFGHVSEAFLWESYRRCRALLFPGVEDFGIVPVECLASGKPVIAVQAGGAAETIEGVKVGSNIAALPKRMSGVFISKSHLGSADELAKAIRYFSTIEALFQVSALRDNAQRFEYSMFFQTWRHFAERVKIPTGELLECQSSRALRDAAN